MNRPNGQRRIHLKFFLRHINRAAGRGLAMKTLPVKSALSQAKYHVAPELVLPRTLGADQGNHFNRA